MAVAVASSLLFFCSLMGARVRLPSTVMLGYRLNCWNTIELYLRAISRWFFLVSGVPSMITSPLVGSSR